MNVVEYRLCLPLLSSRRTKPNICTLKQYNSIFIRPSCSRRIFMKKLSLAPRTSFLYDCFGVKCLFTSTLLEYSSWVQQKQADLFLYRKILSVDSMQYNALPSHSVNRLQHTFIIYSLNHLCVVVYSKLKKTAMQIYLLQFTTYWY